MLIPWRVPEILGELRVSRSQRLPWSECTMALDPGDAWAAADE